MIKAKIIFDKKMNGSRGRIRGGWLKNTPNIFTHIGPLFSLVFTAQRVA